MSNKTDALRRRLNDPSKLTKREEEAYALLKQGLTKRQISEAMNIQFCTASTLVQNVNEKKKVA
jgi:DNA-binding CsgD family transcriptional regulator